MRILGKAQFKLKKNLNLTIVFYMAFDLPGANFINVLRAAFTIPKSTKKTVKMSVFFSILGSAGAKSARRTLIKLNPGVNVNNISPEAFLHENRLNFFCIRFAFLDC